MIFEKYYRCEGCGQASFLANGKAQRFCEPCSVKRAKEKTRERVRRHRQKQKDKAASTPKGEAALSAHRLRIVTRSLILRKSSQSTAIEGGEGVPKEGGGRDLSPLSLGTVWASHFKAFRFRRDGAVVARLF